MKRPPGELVRGTAVGNTTFQFKWQVSSLWAVPTISEILILLKFSFDSRLAFCCNLGTMKLQIAPLKQGGDYSSFVHSNSLTFRIIWIKEAILRARKWTRNEFLRTSRNGKRSECLRSNYDINFPDFGSHKSRNDAPKTCQRMGEVMSHMISISRDICTIYFTCALKVSEN